MAQAVATNDAIDCKVPLASQAKTDGLILFISDAKDALGAT